MSEIFLMAFATFFATIGPLDIAVVFASLTGDQTPKERISSALKGCLIGSAILFIFVIFGEAVLNLFGISLAALRIGGGVLLMLIAIDLVFARSSGASSTTQDENKEAEEKNDISIFPLATPLIAGPGAMGAVVLLMADAAGDYLEISMVVGALAAVLALTLVCMLLATQIQKVLGQIGVHVIARVFGVILAALAAQFVLDGLAQSPLFAK